jgi:predicted deacylase
MRGRNLTYVLTFLSNGPYFYANLKDYKTYYAPSGGLYEFLIKPGESFRKAQVLARSSSFKPIEDAIS